MSLAPDGDANVRGSAAAGGHVGESLTSAPESGESRPGWPLGQAPASDRSREKVCGFCHGQPVGDAASWLDGKPRPPAPCPRCGKTCEAEDE